MPQRILRKGDLVVAHSKVYNKRVEGEAPVQVIVYTPVPAGTLGQVTGFFEQVYDSYQLRNQTVALVRFGEAVGGLVVPVRERSLTLVRRTKLPRKRVRRAAARTSRPLHRGR